MAKKKSAIVVAGDSEIQAYDVFEGMEEVTSIIQANVGAMDGLNEFSLPRAKNGAGDNPRWTIPSISGEPDFTGEVEGIIVSHTQARAYYELSYDETGGGAPDCRSKDGIHGDGTPGGICPKCPLAKFTKEDDGSTVRPECNLLARLFILRPGDIMPTMFNATGANVAQAQRYMFNLSIQGRVKFNHCITRISISEDRYKNNRTWMKWNFELVSTLPAEAREQMDTYAEFIAPIVSNIEVTGEDVIDESFLD